MESAESVRHRGTTRLYAALMAAILMIVSGTSVFSQQASYSTSICNGATLNFVHPGAVTGTTYTWSAPQYSNVNTLSGGSGETNPQPSIRQTDLVLDPNATATATATYRVTPSVGTAFDLVVTVTPIPVLSNNSLTPSMCSGTAFTFTPNSATAPVSYAWGRQQVSGISNNANSGQGNINEVLSNITTAAIDVAYIITLNSNNCRNDDTVIVTVNPTPFLSSTLEPPSICSGTKFNYTPASIFPNTTYDWSRPFNININNGVSRTGTGDPNEQLDNTTRNGQVAVYNYTLRNNSTSCVGTQTVRVGISPVPVISPQTITTCSDNTLKLAPATAPYGTVYTWTAPSVITGSVSGQTIAAVGQNYFHQNIKNTGGSTAQLVYTVTPSSFGCPGASFNVTVDVTTANSVAVLSTSQTPADICSGARFNYLPQSGTTPNTITWERFNSYGITAQPSSFGTGDPNEILTNNVTVAVPVYYAFTVEANGCKNTQDVTVNVNPHTGFTFLTAPPPAICSNAAYSIVPNARVFGTSFNWTRAAVTGIGNSAGSGTGSPDEVLVNNTTQFINVTYNYVLITPNGCTTNETLVVRVNPSPVLTTPLTPPAICSGTKFNYQPNTTTTTPSYSWSRAIHPLISNGQSNGANDPSEILVNISNATVLVPYIFRVTANGCFSDQVVTATVNPTPKVFNQAIEICSGQLTNVHPVNVPTGTVYTWTTPVQSPSNSVSGANGQLTPVTAIDQLLINQTTAEATVGYSIVPVSGTCVGSTFLLSATVKPVPVVANEVLQPVCSGTSFRFAPSNVPSGTAYTWSSPVQRPFNSLTGASAQPLTQPIISQTLRSSNTIIDTASYFVTPSASGCAGAEFILTVPVKPVPVVNNVRDTICTGSAFSVSPGHVPVNTMYTWALPTPTPFGSIVGASARSNPSSNISQVLVNAITAPAEIVYQITPVADNCAGDIFHVTIVVGNDLPVFTNRAITICSATSFDATPANALANTLYTWSVPTVLPAGSVVGLSAQNTPVPLISQTLTNITTRKDTIVYTIQPTNTGCNGNPFTATVYVLPAPKATITGNQEICRYGQDSLTINFSGTAPWNFTYNDGATTRTVSGVAASPYSWVVPASAFGLAQRTLAITAIKDLACNSIDTALFIQKINPLPVGQVVSLHGQYICNNTIDTLFVSSVDSLGKRWMYNGRQITPALITDSIATLTPGSYNALLTNRFGCTDTAAAPVTLYEVKRPVVQFVYDSYCINNLIRFTNKTDSAGIGATNWTWDFGDSTATIATYNSTHTYVKGGKHHVKLTAHQLFCPANIISADSTLDIQYPIPAQRMPSVSAYKRQPTPLAGREIAGYRYQWAPTRGIDDPFIHNPNFNYEVTQDYIINLVSPAGCVTKDSMLVRVFDENLVTIMVPKSFTPNYDGANDILYPYLSGIKTFNYFKIFNRFGQLMFETRNYDVGWNGSLNGVAQPMGIYIWISTGIANDGSLVEKRGEVLLLR